ncbi:hypothetical protein Q6348_15475 [Isoptericola sp. b441]|uniref:Uncharacterized protein n=1 Tax=Actinotalea lenta TaxID=3064654 RepID=A0ABT9DF82_9CELL|nr:MULTISPECIES: hypothetical protein [unclassified Isoptericola]MDO8108598.1 hypothetical protein [Isoptericola sp. b441]MDO8120008.1 hypothetical protein [Isoptericola sp. b490]
MRWDALFADLEARLDAAAVADRVDEIAERTRVERATVGVVDRLRAQSGQVDVLLRDGSSVSGAVSDAGPTWFLLADGPREHLVPTAAAVAVGGLTDRVEPSAGAVLSRLGLGHVLRGLAQDRTVVRVRAAGLVLVGRVDAVGSDHVDLAAVAADTLRPTGHRRAVATALIDVLTRA